MDNNYLELINNFYKFIYKSDYIIKYYNYFNNK